MDVLFVYIFCRLILVHLLLLRGLIDLYGADIDACASVATRSDGFGFDEHWPFACAVDFPGRLKNSVIRLRG